MILNKHKSSLKMAVSIPKRKSDKPKKVKERQFCLYDTVLFKLLNRTPAAFLLILLLFLWSSSSTFISGKFIHLCVSSRKLGNLYCISAGAQPNFEITPPLIDNSSSNSSSNGGEGYKKEIVEEASASVINGGSISVETKKQNQSDFEAKSHESNDFAVKEIDGMAMAAIEDYKKKIVEASTNDNGGSIPAESVKKNQTDVEAKSQDQKYELTDSPMKIDGEDNDEITKAMAAIEEQLREHRSWMWASISENRAEECEGRGIYVYELPPKFNKDLVAQCDTMVPWMNFCNYFKNEALGESITKLGKGWYQTHQYSLEPIFHSRVLNHRCRVYNETEAKLFYVPYYGGLDILRWHFKNVSVAIKDSLGLELVQWLETQPPWIRSSGKDHVFVLGKISWDFRRNISDDSSWGTRFLELDQMQNPIKLLIERQPWHENDIGIPHPTFFHPHSDDEIFDWQRKIIRSERKTLVAFAGAARPDSPENVRSILIKHCNSSSSSETRNCRFLDCNSGDCEKPDSVMELFRESEFCLQPPGDSPTRKSVFDSLISGCIPVFFDPFTAYYQYPWHLPEDHSKYSVFIEKKELQKSEENVVKKLMEISEKKREEMRSYIVYELVPGLVYADSNNELDKFQDAFAIAINSLLQRVSKL